MDFNNPPPYQESFGTLDSVWDKLSQIKAYYLANEKRIKELAKKRPRKFFDVYAFEWNDILSPIEKQGWLSLRYASVVLYPQYPALNYYLDFGNPYFKIALELDGQEFHKDVDKDTRRDQRLFDEAGWKVFRTTGSEVNKRNYEYGYEAEGALDKVIKAIKQVYFKPKIKFKDSQERLFFDECIHTLSRHRLVDFPILEKEVSYR